MIDAGLGKTIVDTQGKKVNTWSLQCIKQMLRYYNFKVSAGNPFFHFIGFVGGKYLQQMQCIARASDYDQAAFALVSLLVCRTHYEEYI